MRKEHNSKLTVTYPSTVYHKSGEESILDEPAGKVFVFYSNMFALIFLYVRCTDSDHL